MNNNNIFICVYHCCRLVYTMSKERLGHSIINGRMMARIPDIVLKECGLSTNDIIVFYKNNKDELILEKAVFNE